MTILGRDRSGIRTLSCGAAQFKRSGGGGRRSSRRIDPYRRVLEELSGALGAGSLGRLAYVWPEGSVHRDSDHGPAEQHDALRRHREPMDGLAGLVRRRSITGRRRSRRPRSRSARIWSRRFMVARARLPAARLRPRCQRSRPLPGWRACRPHRIRSWKTRPARFNTQVARAFEPDQANGEGERASGFGGRAARWRDEFHGCAGEVGSHGDERGSAGSEMIHGASLERKAA